MSFEAESRLARFAEGDNYPFALNGGDLLVTRIRYMASTRQFLCAWWVLEEMGARRGLSLAAWMILVILAREWAGASRGV